MFMSDREKLRKVEIEIRRLARLIEIFLLRIGVRPARQILILGGNNMTNPFALIAGAPPISVQLIPLPSGSVFATPADLELTSDDGDVVIAPDTTDLSGASFLVSIPASTLSTGGNLDATGLAPNADPTQTPVQVSGTIAFTVTPAVIPPPPVVPATSIGFQQKGAAPASTAPVTAAAAATGNAKAPAK